MPLHDRYESQHCSIARTLEIVGERWTLLILRDAFHGLTRFDEFQRSLGIATNTLTTRLDKLVETGILEPLGADGAGRRRGYGLTERGVSLSSVLIALMAWGDEHVDDAAPPSVVLVHHDCGESFRPTTVCSACAQPVGPTNVSLAPAPGLLTADGEQSARTPPQAAAWGERAATR